MFVVRGFFFRGLFVFASWGYFLNRPKYSLVFLVVPGILVYLFERPRCSEVVFLFVAFWVFFLLRR